MTTLRDAAQQALEALEGVDGPITALLGGLLGGPDTNAPGAKVRAAITALRAALEQEQAEPVAWMCPDDPGRYTAFNWKAGHCENCGKQRIPLYTAPQQRKED